jgi:hypothetical protein
LSFGVSFITTLIWIVFLVIKVLFSNMYNRCSFLSTLSAHSCNLLWTWSSKHSRVLRCSKKAVFCNGWNDLYKKTKQIVFSQNRRVSEFRKFAKCDASPCCIHCRVVWPRTQRCIQNANITMKR